MQARQPSFAISLTLNTFDGHRSETVRAKGDEFHALVNDVSGRLRARVRKHNAVRRFLINPLKLMASSSTTPTLN